MKKVKKRILDLSFGILLGIVAIPVVVITSVFIFICSPDASPIFRQIRVGYKGKEFTMLKLRTMTNEKNAECDFLHDE